MFLGKHRRVKRFLGFEALGERVLLAANSLAGMGEGEGEGENTTVVQQGEVAFVFGTDDDNKIDVFMGTETHTVTIDGEDHEFAAQEVRHIVISGQGGNDEANVNGTIANDRVKVDSAEVEMLSADYGVVQLSVSAYLACTAILQILIGPISDRVRWVNRSEAQLLMMPAQLPLFDRLAEQMEP